MATARILVVDDEPRVRETMGIILRAAGYAVEAVQNGAEACVLLEREVPDAIISDVKMPAMSGWELLQWVRRRYGTVPVIMISGEGWADAPIDVTADALFEKGRYRMQSLLECLETLVARRKKGSAVAERPRRKQAQG